MASQNGAVLVVGSFEHHPAAYSSSCSRERPSSCAFAISLQEAANPVESAAVKRKEHTCSVRVPTRDFELSRNDRRTLNRNASLIRRPVEAQPSREQYRLLKSYVKTRHDGAGMSDMSYRDYSAMVGGSPVQSLIFEYRDGVEEDAPLVAASITDVLRDGFSMVYTFFDPELTSRGLGHYLILDHILHAQDLGLPHVYLGYWVKGSQKMDYKRRYKPLEVLDGDVWRPLSDDE